MVENKYFFLSVFKTDGGKKDEFKLKKFGKNSCFCHQIHSGWNGKFENDILAENKNYP